MNKNYDVIVVGAGAAGIACAQKLSERKVKFKLLEARDRVGGRVHSLLEPDSTTPIELGAEFIHGVPKNILHWMHQLKMPFYDCADSHLFADQKKLAPLPNFFAKLEKMMSKLDQKSKKDHSVYEFIQKQKSIDPQMKAIFTSFVEGFHAADLHLIGEKGLFETQEADDESLNGSQLFRPVLRYDSLFTELAARFINSNDLQLQTVLREIDWQKGRVRLTCERGPTRIREVFEARQLVLTVPLGVLKSDSIVWSQKPKALEKCLELLQMGHVQRIVFRFKERFWEKLSNGPISFLHAGPEMYFPTWWTSQPLRSPHLVAWQGGPKALQMMNWSSDQRIGAALKTLAQLTQKSERFILSQVESFHFHNWSDDPFSLGAYSYIGVDGMAAAARFRKAFDETIYFAGEAAASGAARGTVHGAFASGANLGHRLGLNGNS